MKFFSGFSLRGEENFFKAYFKESSYTVSGFSYGSIKAFEYTLQQLNEGKRIDTLQLFSPAFFQDKSDKFKKLQILGYTKSVTQYLERFISQCFAPYTIKTIEHTQNTKEELESLLHYVWNVEELKFLENKGVRIEVYLGSEDKIINAQAAQNFFLDFATVTYVKNANHFLQTE